MCARVHARLPQPHLYPNILVPVITQLSPPSYASDPAHSSVRLVGGAVQTGRGVVGGVQAGSGVVEVFTEARGWSAVCTDGWGGEEAAVVCKQLGYPAGTSYSIRYI